MKIKRLLAILLITSLLTAILFKDVIFKLNSVYFNNTGDGLKSYYCAYYHALNDSTASHFQGMNYPWGESMYFTDGQVPLANTVRFIDHHFFSCAHKIVGIFNFMMIFCFFLGVIFLFLILKEFEIPDWYALISAFAIALLSPQTGRLFGHFSLAWLCWIPMMMYLIVRMTKEPGWIKSLAFALVTVLASLMHLYFFLFAAGLAAIYWFDRIFVHKTWKKQWHELVHPIIQIIVPYIIIKLAMKDDVVDRTNFPYGFFIYRSYPGAVFLPVFKWYAPFMERFTFMSKYNWEARAYIGIIASAGFFILMVKWLIGLAKDRGRKLSVSGFQSLEILFWSAIPLLLLSFGLPFIWVFERLLKHIGFINQLRGLARFSWLFYYVANLLVLIKLYHHFSNIKDKLLRYALLVAVLFVLLFEGNDYSINKFKELNKSVPALNDINNTSDENSWVKQIDPQKYQAIMPLPYFHIGSESCWIEPKCEILKQMFIVSLKTGLPCNGVMLGRTSLSQSYKNIELCLIPWDNYGVLNELPSTKPFLLLVDNCSELNANEKRIRDKASLILTASGFSLYELQIDELRKIPNEVNFPSHYANFIKSVQDSINAGNNNIYLKRTGNFNFEEANLVSSSEGPYNGYERILDTTLHFDSLKTAYIRFWVKDFNKDMVARTKLLVIQSNKEQVTLNEEYSDLFRHIKSIKDDWALFEIPMELKEPDEIIKVLISNQIISCHHITFDEITVSGIEI